MKEQRALGLEDLPKELIEKIILLTSPVDACRVAMVSRTLRSAADSDAVWERFLLPSDYESMIPQSNGFRSSLPSSASKKQLFFRLCHNQVLIEQSKKSFWLDKWSGNKCYMIAARELLITWANIPEKWTWTNLVDSRFEEAAELLLVRQLEIYGKIDTAMLSTTTYVAYLVLKWGKNAYGFNRHPTQVFMGISECEKVRSTICLAPDVEPRLHFPIPRNSAFVNLSEIVELRRPRKRRDGWFEIELGEYFNDSGKEGELEISIEELTADKAGLIVQGIEIRPKSVTKNKIERENEETCQSTASRSFSTIINRHKLLNLPPLTSSRLVSPCLTRWPCALSFSWVPVGSVEENGLQR